MNPIFIGHFFAFITTAIWGVTFVSSKILLDHYSPMSIMLLRFSIAYCALWMVYPKFHPISLKTWKKEIVYICGGLTGVVGYFYCENLSLVYTSASNAGLILASVPILVPLVSQIFLKEEKLTSRLILGFFIASIGIALVIFNGQIHLHVNPIGDFLALLAGVIWACYSMAIKKMDHSLSSLFVTRRTFFYGILFGTILVFSLEGGIPLTPLYETHALWHLLFLGLVASAACYVMWAVAITRISAVKTTNYLYLMPIFTMLASAWVLHEEITHLMILGCVIILLGTYVSTRGLPFTTRGKKIAQS